MMNHNQVRRVLWGNALFSAVSGGLFSVASTAVATFMGVDAPLAVMIIGISLLVYAVLIVFYATRPTIALAFVLFAVIVDTLWVLLSVALLVSNIVPLSVAGVWAVVIVAVIVGGFAVAQYRLVQGNRTA